MLSLRRLSCGTRAEIVWAPVPRLRLFVAQAARHLWTSVDRQGRRHAFDRCCHARSRPGPGTPAGYRRPNGRLRPPPNLQHAGVRQYLCRTTTIRPKASRDSHSSHVHPRGASGSIMPPGGGVGKGKRGLLVVRCWLLVEDLDSRSEPALGLTGGSGMTYISEATRRVIRTAGSRNGCRILCSR